MHSGQHTDLRGTGRMRRSAGRGLNPWRPRAALSVIASVLLVAAVMLSGCERLVGPGRDSIPTPAPEPFDPASYRAPADDAELDRIFGDPGSAAGEHLVLYMRVRGFEGSSGCDFRATAGVDEGQANLTFDYNSVVRGGFVCDDLAGVSENDIVRVHVDLIGETSYRTVLGQRITAAEFELRQIEQL